MGKRKSRHLPILEYLEILIKEYFIADTRRKIYPRLKHREYWGKVAKYKREKILDITTRNSIPSIFNDTDTKTKYYNIYFPSDRIPLVIMSDKDLRCYYRTDKDVIVSEGLKTLYGEIAKVDFDSRVIHVRMKDEPKERQFKLHQVRRVL